MVEVDILTQEEVKDMINSTDRLDKKAFFSFLYLTGCRVGETLKIRTTDFGWQGTDYLYISIEVEKRKNFKHTLKISFQAPFIQYLTAYLNHVPEGDLLWKVCTRQLETWVKKANSRAYPHLFRHTRLTRLAEMGATETQLMTWAGWTDTKQTGRYIRQTPRLIEALADKVI